MEFRALTPTEVFLQVIEDITDLDFDGIKAEWTLLEKEEGADTIEALIILKPLIERFETLRADILELNKNEEL